MKHNSKKLKKNPFYGDDNLLDLNHIDWLMSIGISLKNLKLIINIFNISFFMGMVWLCYCKISKNIHNSLFDDDEDPSHFNTEYFLQQAPSTFNAIFDNQ